MNRSKKTESATIVIGLRMTESLRARLERMRAERGHRSLAETVRELIERAPKPRRRARRVA